MAERLSEHTKAAVSVGTKLSPGLPELRHRPAPRAPPGPPSDLGRVPPRPASVSPATLRRGAAACTGGRHPRRGLPTSVPAPSWACADSGAGGQASRPAGPVGGRGPSVVGRATAKPSITTLKWASFRLRPRSRAQAPAFPRESGRRPSARKASRESWSGLRLPCSRRGAGRASPNLFPGVSTIGLDLQSSGRPLPTTCQALGLRLIPAIPGSARLLVETRGKHSPAHLRDPGGGTQPGRLRGLPGGNELGTERTRMEERVPERGSLDGERNWFSRACSIQASETGAQGLEDREVSLLRDLPGRDGPSSSRHVRLELLPAWRQSSWIRHVLKSTLFWIASYRS
ncbi:translation initiation factor IF-2-like [Balaenoptera musculus]|uniref:Translation initiation factor IF-2-like n=1 Tax=Balaenoptera musculus TaxID=9771 RepID=A0A8B8XF30_BALMU|nr:translation initiation factor IF-2-like [Balaenoptera musculus]